MITAIPVHRSAGAALGQRIAKAMRVILHIGAHRCASTTFQHYLRLNSDRLSEEGIGFWGPRRTRNGLFSGLQPGPRAATGRDVQARAVGRVQLACAHSAATGVQQLLVSDENMMGSVRGNLRLGELYCGVGERVSRFNQAFDGYLSDVVVSIRGLDRYWSSALGYGLTRGRAVPGRAALDRLTNAPRSWRDVVSDIACAVGTARIWVLPFEPFAGRPEAQLAMMTGIKAPQTHARMWLNQTPCLPELRAIDPSIAAALPEGDGRWRPFDVEQTARLRETYADDMMWLTAGADGLASLMNERDSPKVGTHHPATDQTRGRNDDSQDRRMAHAR